MWASAGPVLDDLQGVQVRQLRERGMRLGLVPERGRGDVVLQGQIAPLSGERLAPAERLDRHAQVSLEPDGVEHVPAIQPETLLSPAHAFRLDHLGQP